MIVEVHCSTCLGMYKTDLCTCLGMCKTEMGVFGHVHKCHVMCTCLGMCKTAMCAHVSAWSLLFELFCTMVRIPWYRPDV